MKNLYVALVSIDHFKVKSFKDRNKNLELDSVVGIDGRQLEAKDYFTKGVVGRKIPLTPSEVGCSLSHLNIYENFLNSNCDYLVVFEDDVLIDQGFDLNIFPFDKFASSLPILLHMGGQEGLSSFNKLFGKKTNLKYLGKTIWKVSPHSYRWLWRTCSYIINRSFAEQILKEQQNSLKVADSWKFWATKFNSQVYYINLIQHPFDLCNSVIQSEREDNVHSFFFQIIKNKLTAVLLTTYNYLFFKKIINND